MKRRNFVFGLSAIAGSAGVIGTGALDAARIKRDTDIAVVNDTDALIGLIPNDEISGVGLANGQLEIDIGDDNSGINVNSVYQFGLFVEPELDTITEYPEGFPYTSENPSRIDEAGDFDSAFVVVNQTNETKAVWLELEIDEDDDDELGELAFAFELQSDGEQVGLIEFPGEKAHASCELEPGESFGVSFLVQSWNTDLGDRFSGSISVTAGEPAAAQKEEEEEPEPEPTPRPRFLED